jgi:hypothetical protein
MRNMVKLFAVGSLALGIGACGGTDDPPATPDAGMATGTFTHFASDDILVPTSPAEANSYAFNLDGDPQNRPDNALGGLLATLADPENGADIQTPLTTSIEEGTLVVLHSMQSDTLTTDTNVGWQVFLGDAIVADAADCTVPADCGTGFTCGAANTCTVDYSTAAFTVSASSPTDAKMIGNLVGGQYSGGPATVRLQLTLVDGQPPLDVNLIGAHIQADVTATGCSNGKLGGAITKQDLDGEVLPALAAMMDGRLGDDVGCREDETQCSDASKTIIQLFDKSPKDGMITVEELRSNSFIATILTPDVDLLNDPDEDGIGPYGPRIDGIEDSISLGVGFSCQAATFTAPGE